MEDLFGLLIAGLIFVLSVASKNKKQQRKVAAAGDGESMPTEQHDRPQEKKLKAAAPVAAQKQVTEKKKPVQAAKYNEDAFHQHEGRQDVPCPADEPRPSQRRMERPAEMRIPGLKLTFDRNTVLQGFVMSEILNRPRPGMRR